MAALSWFTRSQLPRIASQFARVVRQARPQCLGGLAGRRLHGSARSWVTEKGPGGKARAPEQYNFAELDKADALMLRKSHETGFLSWFRNGLLATGVGVISYVQSDVGREAGYAFFILGGLCVSFGGASYMVSLMSVRRMMFLSLPAVLLHCAVVSSVALLWMCAVSLYIGRLEVEIIHDDYDDEDEEGDAGEDCQHCRDRRERRGGHRSHDDKGKGQDK